MRVARFLLLPTRDQALLARTTLLLAAIRVSLWVMPFSRVQRMVARSARPQHGTPAGDDARRISWAIHLAGRGLSIDNCLSRALAGQVLLTRAGHDAVVRIGVARDAHGSLVAHAWVESAGNVVIGDDELERYQAATGPGRIA
jgi:hypothetical protein